MDTISEGPSILRGHLDHTGKTVVVDREYGREYYCLPSPDVLVYGL